MLGDKAKPDKSIEEGMERVSKTRLAVAEAEDDLSILQQEMKGLANQIDTHHREDDERRERSQGQHDAMDGVFVEESDSGDEVGVQAEGGEKRKVGVVRVLRGELALFSFLNSYVVCRRRTRTPSSVTWDCKEVTTCPLWRATILKLVFVLKIRLKRRVFNVFKPAGKKFFRSGFLVEERWNFLKNDFNLLFS